MNNLSDTQTLGVPLNLLTPVFVVGLGTTGTVVANACMSQLFREAGRLPQTCEYLLIDAATIGQGMDPKHFISLGLNGVGTRAKVGRDLFFKHYATILDSVRHSLLRLSDVDPDAPAANPVRKVVTVPVFAGCGGTSGGFLDGVITLLHEAAADRNIGELRIYPIMINADVAIHDVNRTVSEEQHLVISSNCAQNQHAIHGDFINPGAIVYPQMTRPRAIQRSSRVYILWQCAQTNGYHELLTTEAARDNIADAAFAIAFTSAGHFLCSRYLDQDQLGTTGRGLLGYRSDIEDGETTADCRYRFLTANTGSAGAQRLRFPVRELFVQQFVPAFLHEVLDLLGGKADGFSHEEWLREYELEDVSELLEESFADVPLPNANCDGSAAGLRSFCGLIDDIADGTEAIEHEIGDISERTEEACQRFESRVRKLHSRLLKEKGPDAVAQAFHQIRSQLETLLDELSESAPDWSTAQSSELRQLSNQVLAMSRPRGIQGRVRDHLSMGVALNDIQKRQLLKAQRQLTDAINVRHAQVESAAKCTVLRTLLGTQLKPGILNRFEDTLGDHLAGLQQVRSLISSSNAKIPHRQNEELFASSLDETVDHNAGRKLRELWAERVAQSSGAPRQFAELLRTEGLRVENQYVAPHKWHEIATTKVHAALTEACLHHLGYPTAGTEVDPHSAFGRIDDLTMLAPEVRPLLMQKVKVLVGGSRPYFESDVPKQLNPVRLAFLLCAMVDRPAWIEELRNLVSITDEGTYDIKSRHVVMLVQTTTGEAGGTSLRYQKYVSLHIDVMKRNLVQPMFHFGQSPESRFLSQRERNHDDCLSMSHAAKESGVFVKVKDGFWRFHRADARIDDVMAPPKWKPNPHSPAFFRASLKNGFVDFVCDVDKELKGFREDAAALKDEQDATKVAVALADMGVLTPAGCQYKVNYDINGRRLRPPEGLYKRIRGVEVGLSDDEVVAELYRNDDLYNLVFWAIFDKFRYGDISAAEIPQSIIDKDNQISQLG